jgi:hypothetical protein
VLLLLPSVIRFNVNRNRKSSCFWSRAIPAEQKINEIEQMTETKATILVVDRKASLVMELRDDSKSTFVEAIGLSTYSNSKAGVSFYVTIFENL